MNASRIAERGMSYALRAEPAFAISFDLLATAPQGVAKLRELILSLAVRGKLVEQSRTDAPAIVLMQMVDEEKAKLVAVGEIKRGKPCLPISEDEVPYELPAGWQWIRLDQLLSKIGAGSTPLGGREVYVSAGVKFLRSQNVWNDGLALNGVAYISEAVHKRMSGTKVVAGDILFNITGASIGRCALVPDDFDEANVSQHVTIIRTVLGSVRKFLHLVLMSSHVQQTVMDVQVGVSREGLSIGKLRQFVIPLPPLAEQARIVARVEELMQLCDTLEAHGRLQDEQHARLVATLFDALAASESAEALAGNWQRIATHFDLLLDRPEAVDALEQTLLQLAVRGLLVAQDPTDEPASELLGGMTSADVPEESQPFDLPEGWEWRQLGSLHPEFQNGASSRGDPNGIPVTVIRLADINNGRVALHDPRVLPINAVSVRKYGIDPGDILIIRVNGSSDLVGKFVRCTQKLDAIYCDHFIRMRLPASVVAPEFLELVGSAKVVRDKISAMFVTTAGQKTVNQGHIRALLIPLPPLAEQHRIVARVEQLRRLCAELRERLQQARATQSRLADALVSAAAQSPSC
ncbi:restriction endonuclease subunit S [Rhodanobacter caeni]|uniref:Restriction endonuclease subunit S n=1 Tax=Rhodanobacter caeni TaxID=657654 RepID=A0ABN0UA30_9GAMM